MSLAEQVFDPAGYLQIIKND